MSHNKTLPPSTTHEDVKEYERTLQEVKRAARKKTAELSDDKLMPKVDRVRRVIESRRVDLPLARCGTDG
ncbi:MAG: hypothetical protein JRD89_10790 [Deltaproteobacteria bacterium]|nr:hypothetical protein [Deltaproteobacteria bacterium]